MRSILSTYMDENRLGKFVRSEVNLRYLEIMSAKTY